MQLIIACEGNPYLLQLSQNRLLITIYLRNPAVADTDGEHVRLLPLAVKLRSNIGMGQGHKKMPCCYRAFLLTFFPDNYLIKPAKYFTVRTSWDT